MNTSTLRGQQLSVPEQIDVAADAGYDGIEPWIRDVRGFVEGGGKVSDLKKQLDDRKLKVVSAIGFANWIVDDDKARAAGLDEARRDMQLVRELGGNHIAAPPIGAHQPGLPQPSLPVIAQRYRALCEVGDEMAVYPQLELWGFSPTLHTLGELAYVSTAAAHAKACVLPDFYHIYKGGNDFESLGMIEASKMHCFHINDYPAEPGLDTIADKDRVFPGDGVCDLPNIIQRLVNNGFQGVFSLELFNPEYWKRDALEVATEGLNKSKAVVLKAIS
ncbi:sugar phosphate isomerase/epimerase family protein [Rubripirellula amarantea]|uniref:sugar phosphate isomerase/epimerase family protein n=1 Tax=Rubripirellula amarantea TaxID=2527999 RepID=UPI0011B73E7A